MQYPEPNIYDVEELALPFFSGTRDEKVRTNLVRCAFGYGDMSGPEYWAHFVLHQAFYRDSDQYDKIAWEILSDSEQAYAASANHRGDGKSARSKALISYECAMRLCPFVLYLQATQEDAANEMDEVKDILQSNEFVKAAFGSMKATSFEDVKKTWGKRAFYLCNPSHKGIREELWGKPFAFVLPRGASQKIRGRNVYINGKLIRPPLVIADDLEDEEMVETEERRLKTIRWFFGSVMRVVPQDSFPSSTGRWRKPAGADWKWRPPARVRFNGTVLHHDHLLTRLMNAPSWRHTKTPLGFASIGEDGKVTYKSARPSRISDEQLASQARDAMSTKTLDVFYREILCVATPLEHRSFHSGLFKYITLERDAELSTDPRIIRFLIVDPSKSASQQADYTGIIAVAIDPKLGQIYVRRAVAEHLNSNAIPARAFAIAKETNSNMIFTEIIGQRGVTDINFGNYVAKFALPIQLFYLNSGHTPRGDYGTGDDAIKRFRAQGILPYYEDGHVWHHPDLAKRDRAERGGIDMETCLLDYPKPADWCFPDTLGYIPAAMAELGLRFGAMPEFKNIHKFPAPHKNDDIGRDIRDRKWAVV